MKRVLILLLTFILTFAFITVSFASGTAAPETTQSAENVVVIDSSIVIAILLGAAAIGGLFGYWIVRKKK